MPPSPNERPDYHFLMIAPNLGAEWFFDAARDYWERFRPIVVSDLELARLIPPEYSVTVTLIARRDTAPQWGVAMAQVLPDALFDPVVEDSFDNAKTVLGNRAILGQPFGVPLLPTPTAPGPITPAPGAIIGQPTPAAPVIPTRPPGGFITQTPTPNLAPPENPPGAITPTPGSIIGDG